MTNIAATQIGELNRVKLSANWMAAAGHPGEDAGLYEAVKAVGEELCPALGLTIPVGKDSMSMKTRWQEGSEQREMTSPLSLVISAFARVEDVRGTVTPQLSTEDNALLLIDLGKGRNALGATALAQVYRQLGDQPADVRDVAQLKGFWDAMQALVAQRKLLAYHDRSDGGLLVTLAEMAFAGHCGVTADIAALGDDRLAALFNEELGAVIQVRAADREAVEALLAMNGLADCVHYLGQATAGDRFVITADGQPLFSESRTTLRMWWAETTWQMQRLRDNPECADQEHQAKSNDSDPGLTLSCRLISMKMLLRRILRPARARKWLCCASRGLTPMLKCRRFPSRRLRCHRRAYERSAGGSYWSWRLPCAGGLRRFLLR